MDLCQGDGILGHQGTSEENLTLRGQSLLFSRKVG